MRLFQAKNDEGEDLALFSYGGKMSTDKVENVIQDAFIEAKKKKEKMKYLLLMVQKKFLINSVSKEFLLTLK